MRNYLLVLGAVLTVFLIGKSFLTVNQPTPISRSATLTPQESAGNTTVDVTPLTLTPGQPTKFEVTITTHSGNPVYDLKTQAELKDNQRQVYSFVAWDGNSEGHHVVGNLSFAPLTQNAVSLTLTIKAIDGQDRVFSWNIK